MTNLSALRTMISSQLGDENVRRPKRTDNYHACYFDLVGNVFRGLLRWLRYACVAVAQTRHELPDGPAPLPIQTADHNVRPCPAAILNGQSACTKRLA